MTEPEQRSIRKRIRPGGAVIIASLALVAAWLGWRFLGDAPPERETETGAGAEIATDPASDADISERAGAEPKPADGAGTEVAALAPADVDSAAPPAPDQAPPGAAAPELDIVRIETGGDGLVAGRAGPGEEIEIVADGQVVGAATAGADGAFVAMIRITPGEGARVVIARRALVPSAAPAGEAPSQPVYVLGSDQPDQPVVVAQQGDDGIRLLQPPRAAPLQVTLDRISYDEDGGTVLAGRAPEGSSVVVYLDGAAIGKAAVDEAGDWSFRPGEAVAPGDYELRLDQLDAGGAVRSRIETPFRREAIAPGEAPPEAAVVQRGDSLWRIAEAVYGEGQGRRYTLIYGANAAAIRDPDLIYPGQIFALPPAPD